MITVIKMPSPRTETIDLDVLGQRRMSVAGKTYYEPGLLTDDGEVEPHKRIKLITDEVIFYGLFATNISFDLDLGRRLVEFSIDYMELRENNN